MRQNFLDFGIVALNFVFVVVRRGYLNVLKCPQIQTQIRKLNFKLPEKVQTVKLGQCQLESMSVVSRLYYCKYNLFLVLPGFPGKLGLCNSSC